MDIQLAYFTDWLEKHGATGGQVHRFAREWRRAGSSTRICPACFVGSPKRGKPLIVSLPGGEGDQLTVCGNCGTAFEALKPMYGLGNRCGNSLNVASPMRHPSESTNELSYSDLRKA